MVKPHGNQNLCNKGTGHQSRYALYKIGVQLCLMTSPLIQEKLSHGLLFRLTLLRDIRKTYAPIMSDVPVRYIYMHQFFSAYI